MPEGLVLLTRPNGHSQRLAGRLKKQGHECFIFPMLIIEQFAHATQKVSELTNSCCGGFILTSQHAAHALPQHTILPVYCVGKATARAAAKRGAANIITAAGNAKDMVELVGGSLPPCGGGLGGGENLLYLRAKHIAFDMKTALAQKYIGVEEVVCYHAHTITTPSATLVTSLKQGEIAYAVFFSVRTALAFTTLIKKADLEETINPIRCICVSKAVAEAASSLPYRQILVSDSTSARNIARSIDKP